MSSKDGSRLCVIAVRTSHHGDESRSCACATALSMIIIDSKAVDKELVSRAKHLRRRCFNTRKLKFEKIDFVPSVLRVLTAVTSLLSKFCVRF